MEYAAQGGLSMRALRDHLALLASVLAAASSGWGKDAAAPAEMRFEALPARVVEPAGNPSTPAKIKLGRLLFFDPILSATQEVACATCHHPRFGWADARRTPLGVGGAGLGPARLWQGAPGVRPLLRNTPSLLNVAFNGLVAGRALDPTAAPMFWDARRQGLEGQVREPLQSRDEMRGERCAEGEAVPAAVARIRQIAEYRELFREAFPDPEEPVAIHPLGQAIAAFERTLIAGDSPFDRFMRGESSALSAGGQRGMRIFQTAGCIQCHGGPMFSDFKLHVIGTSDSAPEGRRDFRTPTLRNLRFTAPYLHHGGLATLEAVLAFYERLSDEVSETLDGGDGSGHPALDPLLQRLDLHAEDFADLGAFLDSLNDDRYDRSAPARVPSGLPVAGHLSAR